MFFVLPTISSTSTSLAKKPRLRLNKKFSASSQICAKISFYVTIKFFLSSGSAPANNKPRFFMFPGAVLVQGYHRHNLSTEEERETKEIEFRVNFLRCLS